MAAHRKMNNERGVRTNDTGNTRKLLLLSGGALLVLVLVAVLGYRVVMGNPSEKWENPNDMGKYLSEKTGLQCNLVDEDWGDCEDEENGLGIGYVHGERSVNSIIAEMALSRVEGAAPAWIVIPGGKDTPEWGILCTASKNGNTKIAQNHCDRIASSTRGKIIEDDAAEFDVSTFLESREDTYTAPRTSFDDGVYKVGRDIVPGTYMSSNSGLSMCKWERWDSPLGVRSSVIEDSSSKNESLYSKKTVHIAPEDDVFVSIACGPWEKKY